jgi:hypothetical protein
VPRLEVSRTKFSGCQGVKVLRYKDVPKVPRCQGKVLRYKEVPNVPRCQGVKVPRLN